MESKRHNVLYVYSMCIFSIYSKKCLELGIAPQYEPLNSSKYLYIYLPRIYTKAISEATGFQNFNRLGIALLCTIAFQCLHRFQLRMTSQDILSSGMVLWLASTVESIAYP